MERQDSYSERTASHSPGYVMEGSRQSRKGASKNQTLETQKNSENNRNVFIKTPVITLGLPEQPKLDSLFLRLLYLKLFLLPLHI